MNDGRYRVLCTILQTVRSSLVHKYLISWTKFKSLIRIIDKQAIKFSGKDRKETIFKSYISLFLTNFYKLLSAKMSHNPISEWFVMNKFSSKLNKAIKRHKSPEWITYKYRYCQYLLDNRRPTDDRLKLQIFISKNLLRI